MSLPQCFNLKAKWTPYWYKYRIVCVCCCWCAELLSFFFFSTERLLTSTEGCTAVCDIRFTPKLNIGLWLCGLWYYFENVSEGVTTEVRGLFIDFVMDSVGTWKLVVSIKLRICYIVCCPQHWTWLGSAPMHLSVRPVPTAGSCDASFITEATSRSRASLCAHEL